VATQADLTRITAPRGDADLREDELAEAVDIEERNALVARSIQELARDRRTIAFCVTVAHAQQSPPIAQRPSGCAPGGRPRRDARRRRGPVLADFADGAIQVVDQRRGAHRGLRRPGRVVRGDGAADALGGAVRAVRGRGTRLAEGKRDCLVLDFVDVSSLSLCTLPSLFGMPARSRSARRGRERRGARRGSGILLDYPGARARGRRTLTLREIQDRAAAFDPLTLEVHRRGARDLRQRVVLARRHGVGLHYARATGGDQRGDRARARVRDTVPRTSRQALGGRASIDQRDGAVPDAGGGRAGGRLRDRCAAVPRPTLSARHDAAAWRRAPARRRRSSVRACRNATARTTQAAALQLAGVVRGDTRALTRPSCGPASS
jgi:hypothetical protein